CKTDAIDAGVLAELSRRDLVPAIWLADPAVRAERERARWRLHLVRHRTSLKNRVHATLLAFGVPCPVSDLFGARGRGLLERLEVSALGDERGRHARRLLTGLSRALPANRQTTGSPARQEGRARGHRTQAHRGHLVHAHPQPTLRSGRRHDSSGRMTAPV